MPPPARAGSPACLPALTLWKCLPPGRPAAPSPPLSQLPLRRYHPAPGTSLCLAALQGGQLLQHPRCWACAPQNLLCRRPGEQAQRGEGDLGTWPGQSAVFTLPAGCQLRSVAPAPGEPLQKPCPPAATTWKPKLTGMNAWPPPLSSVLLAWVFHPPTQMLPGLRGRPGAKNDPQKRLPGAPRPSPS